MLYSICPFLIETNKKYSKDKMRTGKNLKDSITAEYSCPVEATLYVIGRKWKPLILWQLKDSILRYNTLQQTLPGISTRMLTKQLRELEDNGLVNRKCTPKSRPEWNIH
jgi:DNA-binding HxlR family transcriptional regulator